MAQRGTRGIERAGGRERWHNGGWRRWGCALRIYSRQHIHHGGFSWTRNALPWIYICFHPYSNFLPPPSFAPLPPDHNSDRILAGISYILTKPLFFNDFLTLSAIRETRKDTESFTMFWISPSFGIDIFFYHDLVTQTTFTALRGIV